jgi:hypothetical protein
MTEPHRLSASRFIAICVSSRARSTKKSIGFVT